MKKLLLFFISIISIVSVCGCDFTSSIGTFVSSSSNNIEESIEESSEITKSGEVQILTVNDTHGYLETDSSSSISKIASYMDKYPNAIKLAIGDMFQGTGLSNLSKGSAMINVMNAIGFDAMVIGNHEFDWGIEEILKFFDGEVSNGEANFPLLAANVVDKNGDKLAHSQDYITINVGDIKVGIIGAIGETLESSISVSSLDGHEFLPVRPIVQSLTKTLRQDEGCDVVVLGLHNGTDYNSTYYGLDIDLILNAHTHLVETKPSATIPYLQAGCNAKGVGHIIINVNDTKVKVSSLTFTYVSKISSTSSLVDEIVNQTISDLSSVLNEKITHVVEYDKYGLINFACEAYKDYFDVDFAFVNSGGFRTSWQDNTDITYSDCIEMNPFDNELKLVKMNGKLIKSLIDKMKSYDIKTSSNLYYSGGKYYNDGVEIQDDTIYTVVAIDYIFDKENYPFLSGTEIEHTSIYMRDVLVEALRQYDSISF